MNISPQRRNAKTEATPEPFCLTARELAERWRIEVSKVYTFIRMAS